MVANANVVGMLRWWSLLCWLSETAFQVIWSTLLFGPVSLFLCSILSPQRSLRKQRLVDRFKFHIKSIGRKRWNMQIYTTGSSVFQSDGSKRCWAMLLLWSLKSTRGRATTGGNQGSSLAYICLCFLLDLTFTTLPLCQHTCVGYTTPDCCIKVIIPRRVVLCD